VLILVAGIVAFLLGIGLAVGEMGLGGGNGKMANDLPLGHHPFVWILGGCVMLLVGLSVQRYSAAQDAGRTLETDHLSNPSRILDTSKSEKLEQPGALHRETQRLTTDPTALDSLSNEELEHLRLTTESRLERYQREFTDEERDFLQKLNSPEAQFHLSTPIVGKVIEAMLPADKIRNKQERIDDLKLLLNLVVNKQAQRTEKPSPPAQITPPTQAQKREKLLGEIQLLRSEKKAATEQLASRASEDDIRRYENMYDNAIRRLETELETLLIK
jgi:hypothetical protein